MALKITCDVEGCSSEAPINSLHIGIGGGLPIGWASVTMSSAPKPPSYAPFLAIGAKVLEDRGVIGPGEGASMVGEAMGMTGPVYPVQKRYTMCPSHKYPTWKTGAGDTDGVPELTAVQVSPSRVEAEFDEDAS